MSGFSVLPSPLPSLSHSPSGHTLDFLIAGSTSIISTLYSSFSDHHHLSLSIQFLPVPHPQLYVHSRDLQSLVTPSLGPYLLSLLSFGLTANINISPCLYPHLLSLSPTGILMWLKLQLEFNPVPSLLPISSMCLE